MLTEGLISAAKSKHGSAVSTAEVNPPAFPQGHTEKFQIVVLATTLVTTVA